MEFKCNSCKAFFNEKERIILEKDYRKSVYSEYYERECCPFCYSFDIIDSFELFIKKTSNNSLYGLFGSYENNKSAKKVMDKVEQFNMNDYKREKEKLRLKLYNPLLIYSCIFVFPIPFILLYYYYKLKKLYFKK